MKMGGIAVSWLKCWIKASMSHEGSVQMPGFFQAEVGLSGFIIFSFRVNNIKLCGAETESFSSSAAACAHVFVRGQRQCDAGINGYCHSFVVLLIIFGCE